MRSVQHGSSPRTRPGLDRFKRPATSRWTKDSTTDFDSCKVENGRNEGSDVTRASGPVHSGFDATSSVDAIDRRTRKERDTRGCSSTASRTRDQGRSLVQVANRERNEHDRDGNDTGDDELASALGLPRASRAARGVHFLEARFQRPSSSVGDQRDALGVRHGSRSFPGALLGLIGVMLCCVASCMRSEPIGERVPATDPEYCARVLDAESKQALQCLVLASWEAFSLDQGQSMVRLNVAGEVLPDSEGRFVVDRAKEPFSSCRTPWRLWIEAPGYSPGIALHRDGFESIESAEILFLRKGGRLDLKLTGLPRSSDRNWTTRALIDVEELMLAESWLHQYGSLYPLGIEESRADHRRIDDLPVRARLTVELRDEGGRLMALAEDVRVEAGLTTELTLDARCGSIRGRVIDDEGLAVPGQRVIVVSESATETGYLVEAGATLAAGRSDEAGVFEIGCVPVGVWRVGVPQFPYSMGPPGADPPTVVGRSVRVEVAPGVESEAELRVSTGKWITGRVVGKGLEGWGLCIVARSQWADVYSHAGKDFAFRIGPLLDGVHWLTAGSLSPRLRSAQPSMAEAGATDVVLEVIPAGQLRCRVMHAGGAPRQAELAILDLAGPQLRKVTRVEHGEKVLGSLPFGTYVLCSKVGDRYLGVSEPIMLDEGSPLRVVDIQVARAGADLVLLSRDRGPWWAIAMRNGQITGFGKSEKDRLTVSVMQAGVHELRVVRPGREELTVSVDFRGGATGELALDG